MVWPSCTVIVCRPLGVSMSTLCACRLELCHLTLGPAHRLSAILKAMLALCIGCAGGLIVPANAVCPKAMFPKLMSVIECTFQDTAEGTSTPARVVEQLFLANGQCKSLCGSIWMTPFALQITSS